MSVWTAYDGPGDTSGWRFFLIDVRCECGWFLADAQPVMGINGVSMAEGICKRHGSVKTTRFEVYDDDAG
jgi:hypothetical protein